ncbi:MAG: hypothetical protein OXI63_22015 [Candidatus Poribacteria bacterium]|nr:hypothetical protein [Candidatus Poribacteria bacterium]
MKRLLLITLFLSIWTSMAVWAEGKIGFSFSQVIDERSSGAVGEYERDFGRYTVEVEGQIQSGDIYRGKYHGAVIFDVKTVGVKLSTEGTIKGYTLGTLGRDSNIALALTVPVDNLSFDVGFAGRNSRPWGAPSAKDELLPKGFDEAKLDALGLGSVYPAPSGIQFKHGNSIAALVATELDWHKVEIGIKGLIEIVGEGDRAHQILTKFQTSKRLSDKLSLNLGSELMLQFYRDELQSESAVFTTVDYSF